MVCQMADRCIQDTLSSHVRASKGILHTNLSLIRIILFNIEVNEFYSKIFVLDSPKKVKMSSDT